MTAVPEIRIRQPNNLSTRTDGDYVLYWMTAFRRVRSNHALQRAVEWCQALRKPLLVFEALRCGYSWASDRIHAFVIQGMWDNQRDCAASGVAYYPYLEPHAGAGKGLLTALAANACAVVGDDFPCFFLPHMIHAAAPRIPVRFEVVDANGMLPLRATDRVFGRAFDFRRYLQKELLPHFEAFPIPDPLQTLKAQAVAVVPDEIQQRWPAAELASLVESPSRLSSFPIDHAVRPAATRGGSHAAEENLRDFIHRRLIRYADARNQPEQEVASGLSPWLHFGHISPHDVVRAVMEREGWTPDRVAAKVTGSNSGWWGTSVEAEGFLDELITWREVGYNFTSHRADYDKYSSLPEWAQATLARHAADAREAVYELKQFEAAQTHDELWNAAQRQLVREGRIHNYLRMLWGKKILQWSATPQDALAIMIELNNKYALDGRNPNSYSGIFWCLGRYDRPWAPERPVFGCIRFMSSENTARKVRVKDYLRKYGPQDTQRALEFEG